MASGTELNSPLLPLSNAVPGFEFGKRKRWADLVITELVDVLLLVLSSQGKVLYCGNGLKDLLGWKDTDLIDYDFVNLLNADDKEGFMQAFRLSLSTGNPMPSSYVRIRSVPSSLSDPPTSEELVFEINGRPQMVEADDNAASPVQVFFAVAKPHPNKTVAMLDTFLDLQEEHERLQSRVAELRARAPRLTPASPASSSTSSSTTSMYATTSMVPKNPVSQVSQSSQPYTRTSVDDVSPSPASTGGAAHLDIPGATSSGRPDEDEDPVKKKKGQKKATPAEQYVCVTCGRTDSPEWRKGPSGPKTLCNACGLRWAKQTKVNKLTEEASAY
ncbi:white collar 2 type of transcription factor [Mycena maculata]|uniref:White collar 2 type of transcription factor n=1 Tax=Mycena maculata TaxID=230809 RepID=A0AAD7N773_9AGAR|nr:white collar 2 type of transcription factor [Mycena maculata]